MKIMEKTLKELEDLTPNELIRVYDLIVSLKEKAPQKNNSKTLLSYIKVRDVLKGCKGSLSDDILDEREEC